MTDDADFWRRPTGVRRDYAEARFGQVHYRIAEPKLPTQTPLMCFHLSPSSGRIYGRLLADMGRDRIALAPDTPGFGDSDVSVIKTFGTVEPTFYRRIWLILV